jgi:hypothetical protein
MLKNLIALVFISLILIACGEKSDKPVTDLPEKEKYSFDSTELKTEGVDNTGKPFRIEYKFKKGDKVTYRLTTISDNTQKMVMDTTISMSMNQKVIYLLDLDVKDVDEEGAADAEVKITSLKLDAFANGKNFSFEAGKDTDSSKLKQFAEFQALYNNPFSVRFNKKGEILEIYKADKISNKFLEIRGAIDSISTEDKNLIKQDLINAVLNPLITQVIRKAPDKEVYKDSTWQMSQKPVSLMVFQFNYVNLYKILSVEIIDNDRVAVIDADINFKFSGNQKVNQGNVSYNFQNPVSKADGKIYFNVDKGIQIKSLTKTRLEISYTMEANTPQGKRKGKQTETVANTNILELL